jgi:hypothetical protein
MIAFQIAVSKGALEFINALPSKSQRIVMEKCRALADDPFPGQGDREALSLRGHEDIYRLHISRSYTAFLYSPSFYLIFINNIIILDLFLTCSIAKDGFRNTTS